MTYTAAWILIHDVDQLHHRARAIAHHMSWRAPRRRDQFAIDHQQPMIIALEKGLNDDRTRMFAGNEKALGNFGFRGQPYGNAAPMIAVIGLGDDRKTDPSRGARCLLFAAYQFLLRYRQAESGENLVGFFLIAGQLHGDVRRAAGHRRLDALLILAVAELHQ